MANWVYVENISSYQDREVTICGWLTHEIKQFYAKIGKTVTAIFSGIAFGGGLTLVTYDLILGESPLLSFIPLVLGAVGSVGHIMIAWRSEK